MNIPLENWKIALIAVVLLVVIFLVVKFVVPRFKKDYYSTVGEDTFVGDLDDSDGPIPDEPPPPIDGFADHADEEESYTEAGSESTED